MIVEVRSYRIKPGRRAEFIQIVRNASHSGIAVTWDASNGAIA